MAKTRATVAAGRKRKSGVQRRRPVSKSSLLRDWIATPAESTIDAVTEVSKRVTRSLETAGTTILDLNSDGRVDQKDVQLMTKKIQKAADEIISSEAVKDAAKAAAIGSIVAIPIPLVGPAGGAATAVIVYYAYKGAEGLVAKVGEPFAKRRPAKSSRKKGGVRPAKAKSGPVR